MNAKSSNLNLFYKLIKKRRGNLSSHIDELFVGERQFETDTGMLEGFRQHFASLAQVENNNEYDQNHLSHVDMEYKQIIDICKKKYQHEPVTNKEINDVVKNLNRNKSADIYGDTAEHLLYGNEILYDYIQKIVNSSFEFCFIPDEIKSGCLTPVYKNKGNKKEANNYRGITTTPTLSKIIETVLKFRINPTILLEQNPLQCGFTQHAAPLYCSLIMEELQRENKDLKLPTVFVMLDAKSDFDVVRHPLSPWLNRTGNLNNRQFIPKCKDAS